MDLLRQYADDGDELEQTSDSQGGPSSPGPSSIPVKPPPSIFSSSIGPKSIAPDTLAVNLGLDHDKSYLAFLPHTLSGTVPFNPRYDTLYTAPIQGVFPYKPGTSFAGTDGFSNTIVGRVDDVEIPHQAFDRNFHKFETIKEAENPVDPTEQVARTNDLPGVQVVPKVYGKRKSRGDPGVLEGEGAYMGPWASYEGVSKEAINPTPLVPEETEEKKKARMEEGSEYSTFHGKELYDYLGRSFLHCAYGSFAPPGDCYLPKKCIHTWTGHAKGVSSIKLFPETHHLLLSTCLDGKIKIWEVENGRQCMRTYVGHEKAVREATFNKDGSKFLSCSYDRRIKLWDTETGKVLGTYCNGKIPYCVQFEPSHQNEFLAGCSDKKVIQYDIRTRNIQQEYDQHLGAVNTITFIDGNRRFLTSSDDKTLRVWEYGIPVTVKYIADPSMHSMPVVRKREVAGDERWLGAQSLDNQILIYSTGERFKCNKKKRFAGHITAGYACGIDFSSDGSYVISGDGDGNLWIWDWRSCKVAKKMKCHDKVTIGCIWHPAETSRVITCSWDGTIKYWD